MCYQIGRDLLGSSLLFFFSSLLYIDSLISDRPPFTHLPPSCYCSRIRIHRPPIPANKGSIYVYSGLAGGTHLLGIHLYQGIQERSSTHAPSV
ncbi:hypothetical protein GGR51DRAFT_185681 [Nemania sp. FL0031]|nr:hypothetical protein GGR51DRAFT_185681 [Nemania sp. FL0031]